MQLASEYHDKTVYTKFRLDLSDLLKFNKFTALGTDLTLPQVASRYLDTPTRARPGDTILLAGITIDRNTVDSTGGLYQQGKSSDVHKSELVVTIQPKVVSFSGKKP
jgi:MSHA biogenesis protein MshL